MVIRKESINRLLEILSKDAEVFVPLYESIEDKVSGTVEKEKKFGLYSPGAEVELEGSNTVRPPKDLCFPNVEKLYSFKAAGDDSHIHEIIPEDGKKILFGVRPCDVRSIGSMDKVFLTDKYVDSYYAMRRKFLTIVAMGCTSPERTCFCDSMDIDPNHAPGADVMINNCTGSAEENYVLEALSEKGEELLRSVEELGQDIEGLPERITQCTLKISRAQNLDRKLSEMFEHPIWDRISKGCIGCGTCTFICPTCYCFDIDNENYGAEGCKYRCWDSCMFSDYTRMAGGANPRPTKKERLRNRYMHKLSYFNERYGETLCVGCGRCIANCPSHLDISEFIEKASAADPKAQSYTDIPISGAGKEV